MSPILAAQQSVLTLLTNIPPIGAIPSQNTPSVAPKLFPTTKIWNTQPQDVASNPAAYVQFLPGTPTQLGQGITAYEKATFRIHILYYELDAGNETDQSQNTTIFQLRDAVIAALSNQQPTHCSTLTPGTDGQDYHHTQSYHYTIDFRTNFLDTKSSPLDADSGAYITKQTPTDIALSLQHPQIFNPTFSPQYA